MVKTGVGGKFLKKQYVANNKAGLPRLSFMADVIKELHNNISVAVYIFYLIAKGFYSGFNF